MIMPERIISIDITHFVRAALEHPSVPDAADDPED